MMNRRDFMKLSAASAVTMGAVAGMVPASFAENAGVHTDAEVQAMVAEELRLSREVAFYPAAFRGDFDKFYVLFHKLSRAQYEKVDGAAAPGINASHYDMCVALTNARKALMKSVYLYGKVEHHFAEAEALLYLARVEAFDSEKGDWERAKMHYKKAIELFDFLQNDVMKNVVLNEYYDFLNRMAN